MAALAVISSSVSGAKLKRAGFLKSLTGDNNRQADPLVETAAFVDCGLVYDGLDWCKVRNT